MKIAVIGAGFTGLAAALELVRRGQDVTVFEVSGQVGGLAVGFKNKRWDWSVEKFYHHIFENDDDIIALARSIGTEPLFSRPISTVFWNKKIYPFDSPSSLFAFPGLTLLEKVRMGLVMGIMKMIPDGAFLERWTAAKGLELLLGKQGYQTIWESLLIGKFGQEAKSVNLAWFWARIKKRTPRLGTFPGGFQAFADRLASEIEKLGGKILLNTKANREELQKDFDVILSTLPEKNASVKYLDAHVLLLELKKSFLDGTYWINILDRTFPFLVTAEHTNFVDSVHFGGSHLLYIGNYLPQNHHLFACSKAEVLKEFFPWLQKINPQLEEKDIKSYEVFRGPFAQPIVTVNYSKTIPSMRRTDKFYVANQSMIYPWDRGTNYAVKLGKKVARMILKNG